MKGDTMTARWIFLELFHQIPDEKQKEEPPCQKLFTKLVLTGEL